MPADLRASVKRALEDIARAKPELIREALERGLQAPPPKSFPYLQLAAYYLDGRPAETVKVEGDRPSVFVIGLQQPRHDPLALPIPRFVEQEADAQDDGETLLDVSAIIEHVKPKTSGADRASNHRSR